MASPSAAASSPSSPNKKDRPRMLMGEIDLFAFYHTGAVIRNHKGEHVLVLAGWAPKEGAPFGHAAKVRRCDADGKPLDGAPEGFLDKVPSTALYTGNARSARSSTWEQPVVLVKSANPALPAGLSSADPSLVLVPYGPHYGKPIGLLSEIERQALAKVSKNPKFRQVVEQAKPLPGAKADVRHTLSQAGRDVVRQQQGELVRSIPLVAVIEQYLGYAPEEITGKVRKYRIGSEFINLNTAKNSFGSLNDYVFKSLKRDRGSSNNAMDIVAAVREMEGATVDFKVIREGLIKHFNLQAQIDSIFKEALRREQEAGKNGKLIEYAPAPVAKVDTSMKDAAGKPVSEEEEIPFDLAAGVPVGSTEKDRGGGFAEVEELWPAARKYLVEERKLDPDLVDYLYENRNLYAARRVFPPNPRFPYRANHQDVIVAPIFGFKTGQIVGVDTKPLPRKPGEKTEGRNHGRTSQGAFMFGQWGPETKRVVLTEGFIKGIAFLQLYRKELNLGPETCILSRSGAKPSLEIVPQLKEWGAEAIVAFDNDFTGRDKARKFHEECEKQGVPCRQMFVSPSEVTVSISTTPREGFHDEARAKGIEASIIKFAEDNGIAWAHEASPADKDVIAIRLPNTDEVITHLEGVLKDDRILSGKEFQLRAKSVPEAQQEKLEKRRWVKLSIHSKDWDDVVKRGALQPTLGATPAKTAPHAAAAPAPVAESGPAAETPVGTPVPPGSSVAEVLNSARTMATALKKITALATEVQNCLEAVAAAPAADAKHPEQPPEVPRASATGTPQGGASREAVAPPAPSPVPEIVRALLVSRPSREHGVVYSVGTAQKLYDILLTQAQKAKAGPLLTEELPRPAEVTGGDAPRLVAISDVDGNMVDATSALGEDVDLVAAPEAAQRGWQNPRSPGIVEALRQLRRGGCLPAPVPGPTVPSIVQK